MRSTVPDARSHETLSTRPGCAGLAGGSVVALGVRVASAPLLATGISPRKAHLALFFRIDHEPAKLSHSSHPL